MQPPRSVNKQGNPNGAPALTHLEDCAHPFEASKPVVARASACDIVSERAAMTGGFVVTVNPSIFACPKPQ